MNIICTGNLEQIFVFMLVNICHFCVKRLFFCFVFLLSSLLKIEGTT